MLVAVTCPQCRHRGLIPKDMRPRSLACSACGSRALFERGEEFLDVGRQPKLRPMLYESAQVPNDMLHKPWDEDG
jgi:DNA-directed RNA polymerase subunit RPC12/RpoP